jgi:hypothetical protein
MNFKSLDNLKRDDVTKLYDLTKATFINPSEALSIPIFEFVVEEHFAGRIDLICNELYETLDYVEFLLRFNDIDHPLNIPKDRSIFYVEKESVSLFDYTDIEVEAKDAIKRLSNNNKRQRIDKKREAAINNPTLPPTISDDVTDPVQIRGNQIIIGENLFR